MISYCIQIFRYMFLVISKCTYEESINEEKILMFTQINDIMIEHVLKSK